MNSLPVWRTVVLAVLLVQTPPPDPDYVGDEDPAHKGQPKTCSNSKHIKAVKQDCACKRPKCDETAMEDRNCSVYCRREACACRHANCETE
jgi:hypothetical protein